MLNGLENRWSRGPDLNRGPVDYESTALPTELPRLRVIHSSIAWKKLSNMVAGLLRGALTAKKGTLASQFQLRLPGMPETPTRSISRAPLCRASIEMQTL